MAAEEVTDVEASALRRLLGRGLVRAGIVTYVFSGLTLVANLVSGVVVAMNFLFLKRGGPGSPRRSRGGGRAGA